MAKAWIPVELYIGSDRSFTFQILNESETTAIDIAGWSMTWLLKRSRHVVDASALVTKTTVSGITLAGAFNANPLVNTQRAIVTLADTDTDALTPGICVGEIKRMDAGFETPLASGAIDLKRGVVRA